MTPFRDYDQLIRVQTALEPWDRRCRVLIRRGRDEFAKLTYTKCDYGERPEASFELKPENAQALMDELWACGLRPTEGSGSAGSLAAIERHLKDMQKLVFEHLIMKGGNSN